VFLHIDIDSFFASAERSLDPSLKGIPMAVGSRSNLEILNKKRTALKIQKFREKFSLDVLKTGYEL
jgi:DNA polymerase-4